MNGIPTGFFPSISMRLVMLWGYVSPFIVCGCYEALRRIIMKVVSGGYLNGFLFDNSRGETLGFLFDFLEAEIKGFLLKGGG